MVKFLKLMLAFMLIATVYAVTLDEWILIPLGVLAALANMLALLKATRNEELKQKAQDRKRFTEAGSFWPVKQQKKIRKW